MVKSKSFNHKFVLRKVADAWQICGANYLSLILPAVKGSIAIAYSASDDCDNIDNCTFNILVQEDSDGCPSTLDITTADAVDADYQAGVSITSSVNGGVLAGAMVSYRAGEYVLLEGGFSVVAGAVFLVEILGCD